MTDRLLAETEFSVALFCSRTVSGACYILSNDFDWDKDKSGNVRQLPMTVVRFVEEIEDAGFADQGQTNNPSMTFFLTFCGRSQRESREMVGRFKSGLRNHVVNASGTGYYSENYNGLPVYDSGQANGHLRSVGCLNYEFGICDDVFHDGKSNFASMKYATNLELTLSPIYRTNGVDLL